ncbi:hypothetical protein PENSPDRAFT_658913 [Peniophora sp. CONT]|nr:hypothetical protein PENSPDRAFT_658913 [Peniophora sp. CONT]
MGNNISTLCAGNRYHDDSALTRASMSFELNSVAIEPGPTTPLSLRASNAQSSAASHANANTDANTDVKPKTQTQTQPWSCCQSLAQNMDGLATAWTPFFKQLFCKRLVLAVLFILTVHLLASGKINLVDLVRARYGTGDANKP